MAELPYVIDADGNIQTIDPTTGYAIMLKATAKNGIGTIFTTKQTKKQDINALVDIDACKLYENTPYDHVVTQEDVDSDPAGNLTPGETITKYRNNVTDW